MTQACLSFEQSTEDLFPSESVAILRDLRMAFGFDDEEAQITDEFLVIFKNLSAQEITNILQSDFGIPPLRAHQCRTAIARYFESSITPTEKSNANLNVGSASDLHTTTSPLRVMNSTSTRVAETVSDSKTEAPRASYKSVILNDRAKLRTENVTYGLTPKQLERDHPILARELSDYYKFMTEPNTYAQEEPIRKATADVYVRHARLFLGWYRTVVHPPAPPESLSIYAILPNSSRDSAAPILTFLQWLRTNRKISVSYEANLLRGMIKLVKYRFCKESNQNDGVSTGSLNSFDDVPLVRELRKWHRDVGKRQAVAPRATDESLKWITWPEYLGVVTQIEHELQELERDDERTNRHAIAVAYQRYLILSIFAHIPDRQRTIRELSIGLNFVKKDGLWCIRHAPDDYKTGKSYGERPPMFLSAALTESLDEFIAEYRDVLLEKCSKPHNFLFAQPRTGNPLTQDSVYQIVVRACFKHTGKRTNPHLLRDMIVTHVRESGTATEQQLEALALYMGHSVAVQRASYDRRTLSAKVAPAVELMNSINSGNMDSKAS